MRIDPRLVRIALRAIDVVAESINIDFSLLSLENKKEFLEMHGQHVMTACRDIAGPLAPYFIDRAVLLVENEGRAGLIFTKVRKTQ